jgi:hypothetical protein
MWLVRKCATEEARARADSVRALYRKFFAQNTKESRGLRLMRGWLSTCQREQFDRSGHFDVVGCRTGRKYRIYHSVQPPNVFEIDDAGGRQMGLCFAPVGPLVPGDVMLAQKIALETDEQKVLITANRVPLTRERSLGVSPQFLRFFRPDAMS